MSKQRRGRHGFVVRWVKRLWWLRKVLALGAIGAAASKAMKGRRGPSSRPGGGSGPGGSGRPAPVGGRPSAPARSASASAADDGEPSPSAAPVRTLTAVPPLVEPGPSSHAPSASPTASASTRDGRPASMTKSAATIDDPASNPARESPTADGSPPGEGSWVPPLADGSCPDGYPIKANDNSGIFHVPGGRFYERTVPERCYPSADAAETAGYRAAKA